VFWLLLAACSSQNTGSLKLVPTASSNTQAALTDPTASATGTNAISRVRILLNEIEVNNDLASDGGPLGGRGHRGGPCAGGPGGGGPGGGHAPGGDADKTQQGPFVLTLSAAELAAGTVTPVEMADVPAGTYTSTEIELAAFGTDPDGRTMPTTAEFDDFRTSGNTVIVEGTWAGGAYTYAAKVEAEQETVKSITVAAGTEVTLSFAIDTTTWFKAADGTDLDPRVAANHDAIAANIKASLSVGNDDDSANHNH
jgi:hypothetical protein